jgi:hypothetical protein
MLDAADRAASLRWVGEEMVGGEPHRVVTYADKTGQQISLYFNHVVEVVYEDFRDVGGLSLPHRVMSKTAGYVPEVKLMFVADIYNFQGQVTPANDQLLALADKLEELGLEIETVVPVHGQQTTGENFWESVWLGRDQT